MQEFCLAHLIILKNVYFEGVNVYFDGVNVYFDGNVFPCSPFHVGTRDESYLIMNILVFRGLIYFQVWYWLLLNIDLMIL